MWDKPGYSLLIENVEELCIFLVILLFSMVTFRINFQADGTNFNLKLFIKVMSNFNTSYEN